MVARAGSVGQGMNLLIRSGFVGSPIRESDDWQFRHNLWCVGECPIRSRCGRRYETKSCFVWGDNDRGSARLPWVRVLGWPDRSADQTVEGGCVMKRSAAIAVCSCRVLVVGVPSAQAPEEERWFRVWPREPRLRNWRGAIRRRLRSRTYLRPVGLHRLARVGRRPTVSAGTRGSVRLLRFGLMSRGMCAARSTREFRSSA